MNISFPDNIEAYYRTGSLNVHDYTKEDIFKKRLFLFLPFYIMRYEKLLKNNTYDEAWINELLYEFSDIRDRLYNEFPENRGLCNDIFELIIQISDYILRNHNTIKERVRNIMGGEILELYSERMARFEKEAIERGLSKGIAQGMAQGIAQGMAQGMAQGITQGMAQAQAQGITNSIILLRKVGTDDDNIISLVTSQYNIPTEEVMQYM